MLLPETALFSSRNAKNHTRGCMKMMKRLIRNGQDDHHWRKWVTGLALGIVILSGSAYGFAPHLSRLLTEGFPAAQWPATGNYAEIAGVLTPQDVKHASANLNVRAQQLFEQYDGKALLAYHKGQLKLEHYASAVSAQTKFNSYSMAKSLVGALVLKAHAEGLLRSLDDPIGRYLQTIKNEAVNTRPIRSFLHMRSGLSFETGSKTVTTNLTKEKATIKFNPFGRLARLHMGGLEQVQNDLGINPAEVDQFKYQNINTALLGSLLETIYQGPLEQLLSEKIWRPAGAATAFWRRYDAHKPVSPYCCIYATARDWLRVGRFLANNGSDKDPLLPIPLWRAFMGADVGKEELGANHYGDHIYHNILDRSGEPLQGRFAFMFGNGGQVVYMMPEKDLIIVRFGERVSLLHSTVYSAWRSINPR